VPGERGEVGVGGGDGVGAVARAGGVEAPPHRTGVAGGREGQAEDGGCWERGQKGRGEELTAFRGKGFIKNAESAENREEPGVF
jgi:hypothetical protein